MSSLGSWWAIYCVPYLSREQKEINWLHPSQSEDADNIVIGLVRSRSTSVPELLKREKERSNLHILEADVTDDDALAVGLVFFSYSFQLLWRFQQKAAEQVKKITGGVLDTLVNNAALASQPHSMFYELDT